MGIAYHNPENNAIISALACVVLTTLYVGSLYVWSANYNRDHPSTIKKRFFSVFCVMLVAPFFTNFFLTPETLRKGDILDHLGLRFSGLLKATILPLCLTAILFFGPLTMQHLSGISKLYLEPVYWWSSSQDLVWVRNHIMAPLSEEWVFRSCMTPLLLQCLDPVTAVFVGPLLFGIAHLHHMYEMVKSGCKYQTAVLVSVFQFAFTTIFGWYSAYLFLRTGHFVAPLLAHMFCNHMGFPNFGEVFQYPIGQRLLIMFNFLVGLALWIWLLPSITCPKLYDNKLYFL